MREVSLGTFTTTLGAMLHNVRVRVECHGAPSLPADRTILVLPSFSHSAHVASNSDDPSPGWWEEMVGPGKAVDTRKWRVLCFSVLGSHFSPTRPAVTGGGADGSGPPLRGAFPQITPSDMAVAHAATLDALGIHGKLHAVLGASLGGMQALQFASLFPSRTGRLVAVACTGRTTPFTVCIRRMQRRAILADPGYHRGDYADHKTGPWEGLKQAREVGTLFYRSRVEFDGRFDWSPVGNRHFTALDTWEVENYLAYQGTKFVHAYDPNAYLLLSKAMDLMDLGDGVAGRGSAAEGAGRITAKTLLVGVQQDALIPCNEMEWLAGAINARGGDATFEAMSSPFGHDAFLKEFTWLAPRFKAWLEDGLTRELDVESLINTGENAP